jgi:hypothetical protein
MKDKDELFRIDFAAGRDLFVKEESKVENSVDRTDDPLLMPIGQGMRGMTAEEVNEYYRDWVSPSEEDEGDWAVTNIVDESEECGEPKLIKPFAIANPKTYRKLPVEVQGLQWTGTNVHAMRDFVGRRSDNGEWNFLTPVEITGVMESSAIVWDDIQKGWIPVNIKDIILCGVNGEFYPISPEILAKTYEEVR